MKTERGIFFTLNKLSEKETRNLEIAEFIRRKGPIPRADISKAAAINIVSVCSYVKAYIDNNIVCEKGFDVSTGGRKPELVELNAKENYVIGIDANTDRSTVKGVLADLGLKIIKRAEVRIAYGANAADASASVIEELLKNSEDITTSNIKAAGISTQGLDETHFSKVAGKTGLNIFLGKPAVCAACGEKYLNESVDKENFLYMFSDLGKGVIIRKEEFFEGSSSENARYLRPWDTSMGMAALAKEEMSKGVGTVIVDISAANIEKVTEDVIMEAAKRNDDVAVGVVQRVASNLGIRIAYLVNLFSTNAVVVGGGLEKGAGMVLANIKKTVGKLSVKKMAEKVNITPAVLGDDAVSVGAASLAVREIFLRT